VLKAGKLGLNPGHTDIGSGAALRGSLLVKMEATADPSTFEVAAEEAPTQVEVSPGVPEGAGDATDLTQELPPVETNTEATLNILSDAVADLRNKSVADSIERQKLRGEMQNQAKTLTAIQEALVALAAKQLPEVPPSVATQSTVPQPPPPPKKSTKTVEEERALYKSRIDEIFEFDRKAAEDNDYWLSKGHTQDEINQYNNDHQPKPFEPTQFNIYSSNPSIEASPKPSEAPIVKDLNLGTSHTLIKGADGKDYIIHSGSLGNPSSKSSQQKLAYLKIPSWDGQSSTLQAYKLEVKILEAAMGDEQRSNLSARLLAEFTGSAKKYLHVEPELLTDVRFKVSGGHWDLIAYVAKQLGISTRVEEHKNFNSFFFELKRKPNESFQSFENREELAYRKLQEAVLAEHTDTLGKAEQGNPIKWVLPDKLRGCFSWNGVIYSRRRRRV